MTCWVGAAGRFVGPPGTTYYVVQPKAGTHVWNVMWTDAEGIERMVESLTNRALAGMLAAELTREDVKPKRHRGWQTSFDGRVRSI